MRLSLVGEIAVAMGETADKGFGHGDGADRRKARPALRA
jgi:hypothetical protein